MWSGRAARAENEGPDVGGSAPSDGDPLVDLSAHLERALRVDTRDAPSPARWHALEAELARWRDPADGGEIEDSFIEDRLPDVVDLVGLNLYILSQNSPHGAATKSVMLARTTWNRVFDVLLRAEAVLMQRCYARTSPVPGVDRACSPPPKCM